MIKIKFKYLLFISAISVSIIGAYFSVYGLSKVFAGAQLGVIIMASVLELGKIVTTTTLHKYWSKFTIALKAYLTISVAVLMIITSAGIYGFLSNAYQQTANKLDVQTDQVSILNTKKSFFETTITNNNQIISDYNKRKDQLTDLRGRYENRIDSAKYNWEKNNIRRDISNQDKEIQTMADNINKITNKNEILSDSVSVYNTKALYLGISNSVGGDVGPLKYIAQLTGLPMNRVVNYIILLFIFVFDPLAIALILATNRVFDLDILSKSTQELDKPNLIDEIEKEYIEEPNDNTVMGVGGEKESLIKEEIFENKENFIEKGLNDDNIKEEISEVPIIREGKEVFTKEEVFDNESDFIECQDSMKHMDDVQNYDTPKDSTIESNDLDLVNENDIPQILPEEEQEQEEQSPIGKYDYELKPIEHKTEKVDIKIINNTPTTETTQQIEIKEEPKTETGTTVSDNIKEKPTSIQLGDIKEVKEANRGYSVNVPNPKNSNAIERVEPNKAARNGYNGKVIYRRK